jgi:transcriptional regulator with XRE-family HTH domain
VVEARQGRSDSSRGFSHWLTRQLQRRKFKQAAFARMIGVSPSVVSRWCRGESLPSAANQQRIEDRLGLEPGSIHAIIGPKRIEPHDPGEPLDRLILEFARLLPKLPREFQDFSRVQVKGIMRLAEKYSPQVKINHRRYDSDY